MTAEAASSFRRDLYCYRIRFGDAEVYVLATTIAKALEEAGPVVAGQAHAVEQMGEGVRA